MDDSNRPTDDRSDKTSEARLQSLFEEVLRSPQSDHADFIRKFRAEEPALAKSLEELLLAHQETIQDPTAGVPTIESDHITHSTLRSGETVGHFKILEQIGEGGFGEVYLAEQTQPVRRRVALKVIKLGMDTRSVIARFEAERQALAIMDDPGIASVYDAGATPEGRPYFVMEYVKGVPITRYCDREKLDTTTRLELFIKVCNAIQHAHQKGVIHRDIKPGNILVTINDRDEPQPKVIDFGIAKATTQPLTEKTFHTQQGMLIGTPEYMSPEQAEMSENDIDTRSDVYSLGVLLYELLTGRVPFEPNELRNAGQAEILRIIREEDPPRPSTKLTTIEAIEGTRIAEARRTRLGELQSTLRRELEWIPLKALRKDRAERYSSAEAVGADVRRYLTGEPLEAGPESTRYRVRKFVAKRRVPIAVGGLFVAMLVLATVVSVWFAVEASNARDALEIKKQEAEQRADELEIVSAFQSDMLSGIDVDMVGIDLMQDLRNRFKKSLASSSLAEDVQAERLDTFRRYLARVNATDVSATMIDRTILSPAIIAINEQFQDQPLLDAGLRATLSNVYSAFGKVDQAYLLQRAALEIRRRELGDEHPDTLVSINNIGTLLEIQGKYDEAMPYFTEALETSRRVRGDEHPNTLVSINNIGALLDNQGKYDEAMPYFNEALENRRRVLGDEHPSTLYSISNMGALLYNQGKFDEAMPYFTEALGTSRRVLGDEHPMTLDSISNMGDLLRSQGKFDEAMPYFTEALENRRRILGDEHPSSLYSISNMGALLYNQGKFDEAMPYFNEALETKRRVLGDEHPDTLVSIINMGLLLNSQGKYDEALPYYTEALETSRRILGDEHPSTLYSISNMGALLYNQGKFDEAMPYFTEALGTSRRVLGDEHPMTLDSIGNMGDLLRSQGKYDEAMPYYTEALETRRGVLGNDHPDTIASVTGLLDVYSRLEAETPDQGYAEKADSLRKAFPTVLTPTVDKEQGK